MVSRAALRIGALAVAATVVTAAVAYAEQRWSWSNERSNSYSRQRNVAGEFDYYSLVLSWSPTYCSDTGQGDDMQCNRRDGRRFAFVLHGLWPQYEHGYPGDCPTARRPFVPQPTIDAMLDIMPSPRLLFHEYRKHGTCSGLDPNSYFGLARRLFLSVQIPERFRNPFESQLVSPEDLVDELTRVNPGLKPHMIAVSCGGPGHRLKEVHVCFSQDGTPRRCGANENQQRMCSASEMFVPPSRSSARDESSRNAPQSKQDRDFTSPLPGPRMPPLQLPNSQHDSGARGI